MDRYEKEVFRLNAGDDAPIVAGQIAQVLNNRGAFYKLLEGFDRSLFNVLSESDGNAARCANALQAVSQPWFQTRVVEKASIGDFAKLLIWEANLPEVHRHLDGIDWEPFEKREISVNMCTRHGDLHGENALINASNRAMLIDFGAVDHLPSAIDPISLELSPFFHPKAPPNLINWTKGELDWYDLNSFRSVTKIPNFVSAARHWTNTEAFGPREVLASAYIYVLRQLQFPSTNRDLARALITGIVARGMSG